jgi:hypothetical protein
MDDVRFAGGRTARLYYTCAKPYKSAGADRAGDQAKAANELASYRAGCQQKFDLSRGPERNPRYLYLYVKSGIENQTDMMLSNKVHVSVSVKNAPGHADVIVFPPPGGCGPNLFRTFPPVALKQTAQEYSDDRVYPDQDFLTVEPHKFEILRIPFECQSPGIYTIRLLIRYQDVYQSISDTSTATAPTAVCPQSFTLWPLTFVKEGFQFGVVKNFVWNGTSYQEGE